MKKEKVFVGLDDIASFIGDWEEAFRSNGSDVLTAVMNNNSKFKRSKVQYEVNRYRKFANRFDYFKPGRISVWFKPKWDNFWWNYVFNKAVKECDIFLFIFNTFEWDHKDLQLLKEKYKKKIVVIFCGDEARWYYGMKQDFEKNNFLPIGYEDSYDYSKDGLEIRLRYIRNCEKYSDVILTHPNLAQLLMRPFNYVYIPIKKSFLDHHTQQRKTKVKVAHAPSSRLFKGSDIILREVNKLKESGLDFEFIVIENFSATEAFNLYKDCDIIVDQVLCPGGGKLAYECLAMGKVVLSFMAYDGYNQWLKDCPIIDINHKTLGEELKKIILDHDRRVKLSAEGKVYVKKYHDPEKIAGDVLQMLEEDKRDFIPTFFRDEFVPESADKIPLYNKWTNYVSDCVWYKKLVKPGVREGLVF
jgi:hypothetical protein